MRYMLRKTRIDPKQSALLITDQNSNKEDMERIIALAFEGIGLPSVFSMRKSILSLFANGKTSGVVLETGANITQVAPVSEGYLLHKSLLTHRIGGDTVSEDIIRHIEDSQQKELLPRFMFKYITDPYGNLAIKQKPLAVASLTSSVLEFHKLRVAQDIKELYCRLLNANDDVSAENATYELPDGTSMSFAQTRYAFPEIFFNGTQVGSTQPKRGEKDFSCQKMVLESMAKLDIDLREHLLSSIVVAGGNSLIPGFVERFEKTLSQICSQVASL